jgi:ABC-type uncharacterized transport system auxiliary subunit
MSAAGLRSWITGLLLVVTLAGCMSQPPVPADRFYRLTAPDPTPAAAQPAFAGTLGVAPLDSDGLHSERALLYVDRQRPLELRRYHYHFWADPPPQLIQSQLLRYLRRAGIAANVVRGDSPPTVDYLVSGRLQRFERIVGKEQVEVAVAMELGVDRGHHGGPGWHASYQATVAAKGRSMYATVQAYNVAFGRICADFLQDLRAH